MIRLNQCRVAELEGARLEMHDTCNMDVFVCAKNHKMSLKMSENVILSGSGLFLTDSMVYFENTAKVWWSFFLDAAKLLAHRALSF